MHTMIAIRSLKICIGALAIVCLAACSARDELSNQPGFDRLDPGGAYAYTDPAWSPISQKVAYTRYEGSSLSNSGEIYVIDPATRQALQLTHNAVRDFNPAWSPDAHWIVYVREQTSYDQVLGQRTFTDTLRIMNSDGTEDKELYTCPFACGMPSWSPDGKQIAFYASSGLKAIGSTTEPLADIYRVDVDGTGLVRLTHGTGQALGPKWSLDGKYLAYVISELNQIRVVDVLTQAERVYVLQGLEHPLPSISWMPDKERILFPATDRSTKYLSVYALDLVSSETTPLLASTDKQILLPHQVDLSPDGRRLVLNEAGTRLYVIDLGNLKLQ